MVSIEEVEVIASKVLGEVYEKKKHKGLISIYLRGSITSLHFHPESSDIDAIGILSDEADFNEMNQIREWLPGMEPRLKRLQIQFFYLSELKGTGPVRSWLARLHDAEQAVFDFSYWKYVCGKKFKLTDFPAVTPEQALRHQAALVETKMQWALFGEFGEMSSQYFCKGLGWLCYNIHKLSLPPGPFSWAGLKDEATDETRELVEELLALKAKNWDTEAIKAKMPYLLAAAKKLIAKYKT